MDPRLFNATFRGDVNALLELIQEDPLILHTVTLTTSNTPLHIAALLGHAQFSMVVMQYCPQFAGELNQRGFTPIHLAAAQGHREIVREFLVRLRDLSTIKDQDGRNPLHVAAIRGTVQVSRELFSTESAKELTPRGETVLHLAVKHNQYQALQTLFLLSNQYQIGNELFNAKDEGGNTILHLACAGNGSKHIVKLLVSDQINVDVNAVNLEGLTALDIAARSIAGSDKDEIQEVLRSAGAERTAQIEQHLSTNQQQTQSAEEDHSVASRNEKYIDSLRNGIGVVATLFATLSFQLGMNPPGGVWQDWISSTNPAAGNTTHKPGKSIIWELRKSTSLSFLQWNAMCFFCSLKILVILAMTEISNSSRQYAFERSWQSAWYFLLSALFGSVLFSAAMVFIQGIALLTDTSLAYTSSVICATAWIQIAVSTLLAFLVWPFCCGRLSRMHRRTETHRGQSRMI